MKKIIILSLTLIVLLGGAAVYYFYFWPSESVNANNNQGVLNENNNSGSDANANADGNINSNQNTNAAVITDEAIIKEICFTFAERYGSYSNNNDFQSFIDLKSGMTASLQNETDQFVAREQVKAVNAPYFAIFTKVVAENITGITPQKANCQVTAQRTERNETAETASYFQNLLLQFKKEGETWLVNQATWQDKINTQ
ncbi:MAG: hypothetical protein ABIH38_03130 [Patescibacteria group bacterium]